MRKGYGPRHYYADLNPYGVGAIHERDGKARTAATLHRFSTAKARDSWVAENEGKRQALNRGQARDHHPQAFYAGPYGANFRWEDEGEGERFLG